MVHLCAFRNIIRGQSDQSAVKRSGETGGPCQVALSNAASPGAVPLADKSKLLILPWSACSWNEEGKPRPKASEQSPNAVALWQRSPLRKPWKRFRELVVHRCLSVSLNRFHASIRNISLSHKTYGKVYQGRLTPQEDALRN